LRGEDGHDATREAKHIVEAVMQTGARFGAGHLVLVLRGSMAKKLVDWKHTNLSVHGSLKDVSDKALRHIIRQLEMKKILVKSSGEYPTLSVSPDGIDIIHSGKPVLIAPPPRMSERKAVNTASDTAYNEGLFEELRGLRKNLAEARNVPPFMIFGNKALQEMAAYFPKTNEEFLSISGVGQKKQEEFGEVFLSVIESYVTEHRLA
jgi:ATP-dependent DNA helicase RecQ